MNFPHTATLQRLTASGSNYAYTSNGTAVCFVQPLDNESSAMFGMTYSKGSNCYFPSTTDVKEKDRVVSGGVTYNVKGVKKHLYGGLPHIRALLEQI